ncbi:MAG: MBOAT family protein, partial [Paludibacter sp.]|nr:MBOAT family protein [Paludibacter sp.]
KIAIADLLATYVNTVWDTYGEQTGSTLLIATLLFVFQMFADFSGYSDIAIGVGKLMGFRITQNFNSPLFAQNIADFWRKWHISLTQWLTDYVFMPLNIRWREWGNWGMILAILITFELIGLWHGSDWSFALFGLYHGLLYIPLILSGAMFQKIKIKTNIWGFPSIKVLGNMILTFALVAISFILFKADTIGDAVKYFWGMCNSSLFSIPYVYKREFYFPAIAGIIFMLIFEWNGKNDEFAIQKILSKWNPLFRYIFYFFLIFVICLLWGKDQIFIYFQF